VSGNHTGADLPLGKNPATQWIGGWVGRWSCLDARERRQSCYLLLFSTLRISARLLREYLLCVGYQHGLFFVWSGITN